jgi:hypothetical protein
VDGENGAKLRSLSWWREFRLQCTEYRPKQNNIAADISATSRNNIQEFSFWQEKNAEEVKELNVTHGFSGRTEEMWATKMNLFRRSSTRNYLIALQ